jgi:hypothetical protein
MLIINHDHHHSGHGGLKAERRRKQRASPLKTPFPHFSSPFFTHAISLQYCRLQLLAECSFLPNHRRRRIIIDELLEEVLLHPPPVLPASGHNASFSLHASSQSSSSS